MNTKHHLKILALAAAAALAPALASAHPGHGGGQDFMAGVMHPLTGLDHVLMIVAVSTWAAMFKPAERVIVAACLALSVANGASLPFALAPGPALETAIGLTVVGSGILLALGRRWPLWAAGSVAVLFAMIHGLAHGAEGPASSLAYVPGLAVATGGLALAVTFVAARLQSNLIWLRVAGGVSAVAGATALLTN